ncbi:MAG: hypothetical protein A3G91_00235 [Omnitrophica WOR_2 bacterium RIFCSPLOWO2_12_FULL_50_9]|nr:MAG: hypothetical protein A3G91_00235 [Omnitrophica WOR_2 bacterium RIFCSPLOWO2_12_FULL_50_9]
MPCADSSSSIVLRLDGAERFVAFDFAKITCGKEISARTEYSSYCRGKGLKEILKIAYAQASADLGIDDDEKRFVLYLEWDALRSAIAHYLGIEDKDVDNDRCRISAISHDEDGSEVAMILLPPKGMPEILPCRLAD